MRMWLSHDISQDHSGQELQESVSLQSQFLTRRLAQMSCPYQVCSAKSFQLVFMK